MQFTLFAAASLLAVSASAYEVFSPATGNTTVSKGKNIHVKWSAVDTDAEIFSVYLANFLQWPPVVLSLAQNVPRDDLSIDLRVPCDIASGPGWQINFINGTNTYVIYAQSPAFTLSGDCLEPAPTPAPKPTPYQNGTVTVVATSTATLCKTVSTVVFATPIVWIVAPSQEAVCVGAPTVTVTAGPKPTAPAGGAGVPGGAKPTAYPTVTPTVAPTGGLSPTKTPVFTGAASTVQASGLIALLVGAAAFFL